MKLPDPCLWDIFHVPCSMHVKATDHTIRVLPIDPIRLPSGRIVIGDPLVDIYDAEPLSVELPAGRYSVRLALATEFDGVIASLIRFSPGPPVRWEETDPDRHGVDSGVSGFIDHGPAERIRKKSAEWFDEHLNRCTSRLERADEPWASRRFNRESGANLLLFRTARGDGNYPSFLGYSAAGQVVCVVTDFLLEHASDCRSL